MLDNSKVLYVGLSAYYYMDRGYIPFEAKYIDYSSFSVPKKFRRALKDLGITHIYIEEDGYGNATLNQYRKRDLNGYSLNTVTDCQRWLDANPEQSSLKAIILMRAMELNGDLSLIKLIKTKVITSRTKGTSRESEVSVYAFE